MKADTFAIYFAIQEANNKKLEYHDIENGSEAMSIENEIDVDVGFYAKLIKSHI